MKRLCVMLSLLALVVAVQPALAEEKVLTMSTTTSTQSSGLLDVLLPAFEKDTGIRVKVIAKGTGAAIRDGQDGNVDVIFVHARAREDAFVAEGWGTKRYAVMHNDFVIVGPEKDPAGIKGLEAAAALKKIAETKAKFISRGDDSGTHTKEQALWKASGLELQQKVQKIVKKGKEVEVSSVVPADSDSWYYSIGQGMGKTLTFSDEQGAYALTDRGTYIKYRYGKTPPVELLVLSEGDELLANPYGIIPVNPAKHPHVKIGLATTFAEWLVSVKGQKLINDYRLEGKQLFIPDAIDAAKLK